MMFADWMMAGFAATIGIALGLLAITLTTIITLTIISTRKKP